MPDDTLVYVRRRAMDILARREHSLAELGQKLVTRGLASELVQQVVSELAGEGLVSDERFAESLMNSRRNRGFGPVRVTVELREKGVSESLIAARVEARETDWFKAAVLARTKKFGKPCPNDYKERARQARFLQSRGFTYDQIDYALQYEQPPEAQQDEVC